VVIQLGLELTHLCLSAKGQPERRRSRTYRQAPDHLALLRLSFLLTLTHDATPSNSGVSVVMTGVGRWLPVGVALGLHLLDSCGPPRQGGLHRSRAGRINLSLGRLGREVN
jgi:hypothetical protein